MEEKRLNREFEILHHSYRLRWASGKKLAEILSEEEINDWQYFTYNLVFRASGDLKDMCMEDSKKWKKGRVCIDPEKYDEYIFGLEFDFSRKESEVIDSRTCYPVKFKNKSGIDKESLFVNGYLENFSPFLIYNEKFDVFQFREYFQYHPATVGTIKFIDEMKNGPTKYGITSESSQFYSCLKALEGFWD